MEASLYFFHVSCLLVLTFEFYHPLQIGVCFWVSLLCITSQYCSGNVILSLNMCFIKYCLTYLKIIIVCIFFSYFYRTVPYKILRYQKVSYGTVSYRIIFFVPNNHGLVKYARFSVPLKLFTLDVE